MKQRYGLRERAPMAEPRPARDADAIPREVWEGLGLTSRQRDVLLLMAHGFSAKEIARELGISYRTVDAIRDQVMRRLGTKNGCDACLMLAAHMAWYFALQVLRCAAINGVVRVEAGA